MPNLSAASGLSATHTADPALSERFGTWFFAVVAVIVMPLLPLLVEAAKNNLEMKPENLFLTTAVLAVGFGFSSESNLFRASYALLFFFSVGLDFHSDSQKAGVGNVPATANAVSDQNNWLFGHPGYFVIVVCLLHAIERMYWHIGEKKKFPDWLK